MGTSYASTPQACSLPPARHNVCNPVGNDEYGTLIFDCRGRICGGGSAGDTVFGADQGRPTGRMISSFIPDILLQRSALRYDAISLASLCESSDWHRFNAKDVLGRGFIVEIRVSRKQTNNKEVFVLNFHRPGRSLFDQTS
jgi:hypothetical protein